MVGEKFSRRGFSARLARGFRRFRGAGSRPPGDPFGRPFGVMPRKVRAYESCYDPVTGGFKVEGKYTYQPVELEVGRLWYSIVVLHRPTLVLETGTAAGYSTACIAAALQLLGGARTAITIDPSPREQLWADTGLEANVHMISMTSQDAKDHVATFLAGRQLDMLVLDSDHHYDTVMNEIVTYEPMLRDGGLILMHDTLFFDGVGMAVEQMMQNERFELITLDTPRHHERNTFRCPGITIARKKRSGSPVVAFDEAYRGVSNGRSASRAYLRTRHG